MRETGRLHDLYLRFGAQVQFLHVYILEAHPTDGWWLGAGLSRRLVQRFSPRVALDVASPKTLDERRAIARRMQAALDYDIPLLVDEMDNAVAKAYAALPNRLFLIGMDGRVIYRGGPGPYGFSPKALGEAIESYLNTLERSTTA